jgi:hypothetical protein
MLPLDSALFTVRHPAGEPLLFKVLKAAIVIGELSVKIIDRVPQMLRDCLTAIHGKNSMPYVLLDVKG